MKLSSIYINVWVCEVCMSLEPLEHLLPFRQKSFLSLHQRSPGKNSYRIILSEQVPLRVISPENTFYKKSIHSMSVVFFFFFK